MSTTMIITLVAVIAVAVLSAVAMYKQGKLVAFLDTKKGQNIPVAA